MQTRLIANGRMEILILIFSEVMGCRGKGGGVLTTKKLECGAAEGPLDPLADYAHGGIWV